MTLQSLPAFTRLLLRKETAGPAPLGLCFTPDTEAVAAVLDLGSSARTGVADQQLLKASTTSSLEEGQGPCCASLASRSEVDARPLRL